MGAGNPYATPRPNATMNQTVARKGNGMGGKSGGLADTTVSGGGRPGTSTVSSNPILSNYREDSGQYKAVANPAFAVYQAQQVAENAAAAPITKPEEVAAPTLIVRPPKNGRPGQTGGAVFVPNRGASATSTTNGLFNMGASSRKSLLGQ